MSNRTVGKYALGICDRSGLTFKLKDLYPQIVDGKDSGLRVSLPMLDRDQPQNFLGQFPINDPQALPFARTDTNIISQRRIAWNWNPVGDNNGLSALYGFSSQTSTQATGGVGTVTVSVS
tara:strand:- start:1410 stop:1769 length:360 start_codon:yes stop_codon:yes gene_type:complete